MKFDYLGSANKIIEAFGLKPIEKASEIYYRAQTLTDKAILASQSPNALERSQSTAYAQGSAGLSQCIQGLTGKTEATQDVNRAIEVGLVYMLQKSVTG